MSTPQELLRAFPSGQRFFILPEWKLVYVSVPKNACTSLKWLLAELAGEDLEAIRTGGLTFNPSLEGKIHFRSRWKKVPPLKSLDAALWDQVNPEDWMVFGVLRDPRLRLFSAWQDKYLLRNPGYWRSWSQSDLPLPTTVEQVAAQFAEFCRAMQIDPGHQAHRDPHFKSQVHALRTDLVPYRRLYDMSELGDLMSDLNQHLADLGHAGDLVLGRSNSSPFKPCGPLFADGAREDIEKIYADDFARWGDRWDFSRVESRPVTWTDESFAHAHALVEVHERLAEVVREGRREQRKAERLNTRVSRLQRRLQAQRRRTKTLRRRVRALEAQAAARPMALPRRVARRAARLVRRG